MKGRAATVAAIRRAGMDLWRNRDSTAHTCRRRFGRAIFKLLHGNTLRSMARWGSEVA
ncbi:MAG TPA: hypothetical protein PLL69_07635 [Gemmatimonadales bacterium]|nr:hypothetical protein [Gemmatimonadales bacterium]